MTQASVGFHCPECVKSYAKSAPVYDARNLPRDKPWVTYALIAINVAVFAADLATGGGLFRGGGAPYKAGALNAVVLAGGDWYRLLTTGFLHYGVIHIGVNMYSLYILGPQLEKLLGSVRFLALYMASLLAGSLGAILLEPGASVAGASGAIFGLLGAALAFQVSNKINIWRSGLGNVLLINLFITFAVPYISKGGHLGGLAAGGLCGYAMFELERRKQSPWVGVGAAVIVGAVCVTAALLLAPELIVVYRR